MKKFYSVNKRSAKKLTISDCGDSIVDPSELPCTFEERSAVELEEANPKRSKQISWLSLRGNSKWRSIDNNPWKVKAINKQA